jgi:hypothetical protein
MRVHGRTASLLLVGAGFLVALVLAETGLRVLGVSYPSFYTVDAERAFAQRPGACGWFTPEGRSWVRVSSDGWRDEERSFEKPAGTLRIAVLGDSYVQALQLPQEQGLCARLAEELRGRRGFAGRDVEVLNFGVASYSTAQELLTLRHRVWQYAPDLVLVAVFTQNDIRENARALIGEELRPYFVLHGDSLVLDDSFRGSARYRHGLSRRYRFERRFVERSRVLQLVGEARRRALQQRAAAGRPVEPDDSPQLYREPSDARWQEAWRVTEHLLLEMHRECARHGARFAAVTLSNPIQVDPDTIARARLARQLGVADLFYPERRIQRLGERAGFPVLALAPILQRIARERVVCLHGFDNAVPCGGHWNAAGHRVAAGVIAEFIRQAGSMEGRASVRATEARGADAPAAAAAAGAN